MKSIFSHLFFITGEIILLGIQYSRAEIFAFDVLPELADAEILGIYGSHLFAVVWLFSPP